MEHISLTEKGFLFKHTAEIETNPSHQIVSKIKAGRKEQKGLNWILHKTKDIPYKMSWIA